MHHTNSYYAMAKAGNTWQFLAYNPKRNPVKVKVLPKMNEIQQWDFIYFLGTKCAVLSLLMH